MHGAYNGRMKQRSRCRPACDWERAELRNTFCKNHRELVLKQLGDIEDLELWLDRYHPAGR